MRGLEAFLAHLADPAPGFRCVPAGSRRRAPSWSVRVRHRRGRGATRAHLAYLDDPVARALWGAHDGLRLYDAGRAGGPALRFLPIRALATAHGGVAIATIADSPDVIVLRRGACWWMPHDDRPARLGTLDRFLADLARDPPAMFARLGGAVRYFEATRQWVPSQYVPELRDAPPLRPPAPMRHVVARVFLRSGRVLVDAFHPFGGLRLRDAVANLDLSPGDRVERVELQLLEHARRLRTEVASARRLALTGEVTARQVAEVLVARARALLTDG